MKLTTAPNILVGVCQIILFTVSDSADRSSFIKFPILLLVPSVTSFAFALKVSSPPWKRSPMLYVLLSERRNDPFIKCDW